MEPEMKELTTKARQLLPKTKEERAIVRKYIIKLTTLIDYRNSDEVDGS